MTRLSSILKKTATKTLRNRSGEQKGVRWIANKIKQSSDAKPPRIGQMFAYVYDAKTKGTLPYFDQLPLVIPIEMYADGFLACNFHYLPIKERTFLLMKLSALNDDDTIDANTALKLSYKLLAGVSKYKSFKPTLHRYLYSHIKSKTIRIPPEDWFDMIKLPLGHFSGAGKTAVYKSSKGQY